MGLASHFFSIAQGFFSVLVLAILCAALLLAASVLRVVVAQIKQRLSRRAPAWPARSRARP